MTFSRPSTRSSGLPTGSNFSYGLSEWVLEPVVFNRGETLERALTPGSDFRQIIDSGVPQQTVVTFWVYPDSFGLFRQPAMELQQVQSNR